MGQVSYNCCLQNAGLILILCPKRSISLSLGRPPSLKNMPYDPSALRMSHMDISLFPIVANNNLVDLSDEEDLWQPPHLLETDKVYPKTKCHSTLTFIHFCNLAQVYYPRLFGLSGN